MNGKFPDLSQSFHSLVPMLHPEEWPRKQGLLRTPVGLARGERQRRDGHGRAKFKMLFFEGGTGQSWEGRRTARGMQTKRRNVVEKRETEGAKKRPEMEGVQPSEQ